MVFGDAATRQDTVIFELIFGLSLNKVLVLFVFVID